MPRRAIVFIVILLCLILMPACTSTKNTNIKVAPSHLPMPLDKVELSQTLSCYKKIDKSTTHAKLMQLIESEGFKYRIDGGNDGDLFLISTDDEVIQKYDAKPGEYIEVYYPHLYETHKICDIPLHYIYHFHGKRYWLIIQQDKVGSYNPGYWGFNKSGVWVRQWPTLEGNDEYTSFMNAESAIQFVAHYCNL